MKHFSRIFLGLIIFSSFATAKTMDSESLNKLTIILNYACGDLWCDGGDYNYEFLPAEFHEPASRLILNVKISPYPFQESRVRKCIFYVADEEKVFGTVYGLTESFMNTLDGCVDTITENP